MAQFDRSSKWLIQHHGDALLRLAGVADITAWRPLQAELVQPGQLPDGLLEVETAGRPRPDLYVVEIATYPEQRLVRQLARDALLVYLDQDRLPEVLALLLRPKGRLQIPEEITAASAAGWTELRLRWRVVRLWEVEAVDLLASGDPGLMPWVPLTRFAGPPARVLRRCRAVIDRVTRQDERANLLAVTQVLTSLRYNDPRLLAILGGREAMIESPVLKELEAEWKAEAILRVLRARFGALPAELEAEILGLRDEARLDALLEHAARCESLEAFRAGLS
jgi:hypothetical protein